MVEKKHSEFHVTYEVSKPVGERVKQFLRHALISYNYAHDEEHDTVLISVRKSYEHHLDDYILIARNELAKTTKLDNVVVEP